MNTNENLMLVAIEECSEVQKELSKSMRFGLFNHHPLYPDITNEKNLLEEYYQLQAVVEYMQNIGLLKTYSNEVINKIKEDKINKVLEYMEVSAVIGTIR